MTASSLLPAEVCFLGSLSVDSVSELLFIIDPAAGLRGLVVEPNHECQEF